MCARGDCYGMACLVQFPSVCEWFAAVQGDGGRGQPKEEGGTGGGRSVLTLGHTRVHGLFCVSVCCNSSPSLLTVLTRLVTSPFSHSLTDDVIVLTPPMEQRDSHSMGGEAFTEDSGGH